MMCYYRLSQWSFLTHSLATMLVLDYHYLNYNNFIPSADLEWTAFLLTLYDMTNT